MFNPSIQKILAYLFIIYLVFRFCDGINITRFFMTETYKKKHFSFENYAYNSDKIEEILYELHPIGSEVEDLFITLRKSGVHLKSFLSLFQGTNQLGEEEKGYYLFFDYPLYFGGLTKLNFKIEYDEKLKIKKIKVYKTNPLS